MIEVRNLVKRYGSATVLDCPVLDIDSGGVTALIGPNGAGKSTLLSIMARLDEPDEGTVTVGGHDVQQTPSRELARVLAVLRQDNRVAVRLTVRELVEFGRFPHSGGRLQAADFDAIDHALAAFDLHRVGDRRLDQLSGGQRQRAFIAAVLAQEASYVLLDEPLNNLDLRQSARTMGQVRRLADEFAKTVIVVLHDVNTAAHYADRIVGMANGTVVADGSPNEVVREGQLEALFGLPVPVIEVDGRPLALHFLRDLIDATEPPTARL